MTGIRGSGNPDRNMKCSKKKAMDTGSPSSAGVIAFFYITEQEIGTGFYDELMQ